MEPVPVVNTVPNRFKVGLRVGVVAPSPLVVVYPSQTILDVVDAAGIVNVAPMLIVPPLALNHTFCPATRAVTKVESLASLKESAPPILPTPEAPIPLVQVRSTVKLTPADIPVISYHPVKNRVPPVMWITLPTMSDEAELVSIVLFAAVVERLVRLYLAAVSFDQSVPEAPP